MQSILLTGGTGYLGGLLRIALLAEGNSVMLFRRGDNIADTFRRCAFDTVIHCATCYGRNGEGADTIRQSNVQLPIEILQHAISHGVRTFVNTDTALPANTNLYAQTKKEFASALANASSQIQGINIELEQFYGPADHATKFPTFVIRSLLNLVDHIDLTAGEQKRRFLYVDDVISAYKTVLNHPNIPEKTFSTFQVAAQDSISIKDFVLLTKKLTGNTSTVLKFGTLPYRPNEPMDSPVDLQPIMSLGWQQSISLTEGLNRTISAERSSCVI